jgi:lipopolysaccharide/colanic/teichoic acid biosynthesis glycosyltransferase
MTSLRIYDVLPGLRQRRAALTSGPRAPGLPYEDRARRALNVAVAGVGLVVSAPLMLAIGVLIRLTSKGPILYRQTRVGLNRRAPGGEGDNRRRATDLGGKPFTIYKFRTMQVDAGGQRQVWASPGDPRVTRVGRVLRKLRLDELPQLVNVLRGDMNVVGPRPEQPGIFADLRHQVHRYAERQCVRPGITGWAQINHPYDKTVEDVRRKVVYDLDYIARQSLAEDLKIMLLTAPTVVLGRGAW